MTNFVRQFFMICVLVFTVFTVNAQSIVEVDFDIPSQTAANALVAFAEQANISLLFPFNSAENITANEVFGNHTVASGLDNLLQGTALYPEFKTNGTILIKLKPQAKVVKHSGAVVNSLVDDISATEPYVEKPMEIINVHGFKRSLLASTNRKRYSYRFSDSVTARDVGLLPDDNVAEALQRLPAIQLSRAANGEGQAIQIRGMSDNNVLFNGFLTTGSEVGRGINFQDFPSTLFSSVEVNKSPSADQIEGALGGTIELNVKRPLAFSSVQSGSVQVESKYNQSTKSHSPNVGGYWQRTFLDTAMGDIGFVLNLAHKQIDLSSEVYGGGDYTDAPSIWYRRHGGQTPAGNSDNNHHLNDHAWQYATGVDASGNKTYGLDVNNDGLVDSSDIYYVPSGTGIYSRNEGFTRDAINTSIQWKPTANLSVFTDISRVNVQETLNVSRFSLVSNYGRAFPLERGENTLSLLDSGIYQWQTGFLGGVNMRQGGVPSSKLVSRETSNINVGINYVPSNHWDFSLALSHASGGSNKDQSQLGWGYDWNQDELFDNNDWGGIMAINVNDSPIPSASLYQPLDSTQGSDPLIIDTANMQDPRLRYYQMQRNADDVDNVAKATEFDASYFFEEGTLSAFHVGIRYASNRFQRVSFKNVNQGVTQLMGDQLIRVNIQNIAVNPNTETDPQQRQIANRLSQCNEPTSSLDTLLATASLYSTACPPEFYTEYFNLADIRAKTPDGDSDYYEVRGLRYDVTEDIQAAYAKFEFHSEFADFPVYGDFGVRFVDSEVRSSGYIPQVGTDNTISFAWTGFQDSYHEMLPSLNVNIAISPQQVLRIATSRTMQRPSLQSQTPSTKLSYNQQIEGYSGIAIKGNPQLAPITGINFDLGYEWYYRTDSYFSLALFSKQLDSSIYIDTSQTQDFTLGDKRFLASQPESYDGSTVNGAELSWLHSFSNYKNWLRHGGINFNYTYNDGDTKNVDQEGDITTRKATSEHSYNATLFYEYKRLSARVAYNWRDAFVRRPSVNLGFNRPETLPEIEAKRGQLDVALSYMWNDDLELLMSAVNINQSSAKRYMKYRPLINYNGTSDVRYNLGVRYRF